MRSIIIVVTVLTLTGCNLSYLPKQTKVLRYQCGTTPLTVTQDDRKARVSFVIDGEQHGLPQVIVGSGIKYSDGKYTFWSKGKNAFVERADKIIINDCVLTG